MSNRLITIVAGWLMGTAAVVVAAPPAGEGGGTPWEFFGLNAVTYFHYRDEPGGERRARGRLDALKKAGAAADRFDLWWGVVEPTKGRFDWAKADWLIDFYARNTVDMLPILSYRAAWMTKPPQTEEDFADFGRYTFAAVSRYKSRVRQWEVWNEPNIPTFWDPPNAEHYARLLEAAYGQAKRADPRCVVVGSSSSETDLNWVTDIAKHGALRHMDVLSFHPYSMADGPGEMHLALQIENLRATLAKLGAPDMPLWITEMGWIADVDKPEEVAKQCRYMVQSHVIALAGGVERLYWFNLQDWREKDHLEGWGMLSPDGTEKPTLGVYRKMVGQLTGARFVGYLPVEQGSAYVFERAGRTLVVAWARRGREARLVLPAGGVVTDLAGKRQRQQGGTTVALGPDPVYVAYPKKAEITSLTDQRPAEGNLLVNPSFEERDGDRPYGWHKGVFHGGEDQGTFGVSGEDGSAGGTSASLSATTSALYQSFPVPALPGQTFTLTAKVKATDATGENGVQLLFLSGPGWGWKGGPQTQSVTGTTGWRTVTLTGTCPADANVVRVNLVSKGNRGTVLFDDLTLTAGKP